MEERAFFLPVGTDPPTRLAVYSGTVDGDELIDIADEDLTSASPTAQPLRTEASAVTRVCLTREQAAWLRDALVVLDLGPSPAPVVEAGGETG